MGCVASMPFRRTVGSSASIHDFENAISLRLDVSVLLPYSVSPLAPPVRFRPCDASHCTGGANLSPWPLRGVVDLPDRPQADFPSSDMSTCNA